MSPESQLRSDVPTVVRTSVDGDVGTVLLDRPAARNAITVELARQLERAVLDLANANCRVIVLRGAGDDFCAGGDVGELAELHAGGREAMSMLFDAFAAALRAIRSVPVPVVAAVHGHAVAGGFELVQSCDVAVARTDARLADIHSRFGQVPGGGSTQLLPRLVGRARAMGLILTGDEISGAQAADWGLVYAAAAPVDWERTVAGVVARLAANPTAALARSKQLVGDALERPLNEGLRAETDNVLDHLSGEGDRAFASFHDRKEHQ